jgi:hypothetical protein
MQDSEMAQVEVLRFLEALKEALNGGSFAAAGAPSQS